MGKPKGKYTLDDVLSMGTPHSGGVAQSSLDNLLGLPEGYEPIYKAKPKAESVIEPNKPTPEGEPKLANQTPKPVEPIDVSEVSDTNISSSLFKPIQWFDKNIIEPIANSEAFHPIKKSVELVKKGVIPELPRTKFELDNLPKTQEEEDHLEKLNNFGMLNGLPKTAEDQLIYQSQIPFNTYTAVNQTQFQKKLRENKFAPVDLTNPDAVGQAKLEMDRVFSAKEAEINKTYKERVRQGDGYIFQLSEEGVRKIAELRKEQTEFEKNALNAFTPAAVDTYGSDDISKNETILAEQKLKYFDPNKYSTTVAAGAKDPFTQKEMEQYSLSSQLEASIRKAERLSIDPGLETDPKKQQEYKIYSDEINKNINGLQGLSNKYPEVRKTELAKVLGEMFQKDKGGFDSNLGISKYITLNDEKELVAKFMASTASDADKRLVQEMYEEDEMKMKNDLAKHNDTKLGRAFAEEDIERKKEYETVDRFSNLNFGYGNRLGGAVEHVFEGTARSIRDLVGASSTKARLEESVKDKMKLKGYQLEGQAFYAPETITDIDTKSKTFGEQIKNTEKGIQWRNAGYNIAESAGTLVGQIAEGYLLGGAFIKGAEAGRFVAGLGREAVAASRASVEATNRALGIANRARTTLTPQLIKGADAGLETAMAQSIRRGDLAMDAAEGAKSMKEIAQTIVPAYLMTYDDNLKHSYDLFGVSTPWKNQLYAHSTALLEGVTEMVSSPFDQLRALKGFSFADAKSNIYKFIKGLDDKGLKGMVDNNFKEKLVTALRSAITSTGKGFEKQHDESVEEVLSNVGEFMLSAMLDSKTVENRKFGEENFQTYMQTFMGMAFMGAGGIRTAAINAHQIFNNKHYKDAIIGTGRNADSLKLYLDGLRERGEINEGEYKEKLEYVELARQQYKGVPQVNMVTGNKLSQSSIANYMYATVNKHYIDTKLMGRTINDDGTESYTLPNKESQSALLKTKKRFTDLQEASLNVDDITYNTLGIPTVIMPELPPDYAKKPEIIAIQKEMEKHNQVIAELHAEGYDAKGLYLASASQKQINKKLLAIKEADPQTEEFEKFEQTKKANAFADTIASITTLEQLDKIDQTKLSDAEKVILGNKRSEIQTKINSQPIQKPSAQPTFGSDKITDADFAAAEIDPITGKPKAPESNIQDQSLAQKPTGDSQAVQVNETLTGEPIPAETPPVVEPEPAEIDTEIEKRMEIPNPPELSDGKAVLLLYGEEEPMSPEDNEGGESLGILSPRSQEERNKQFQALVKDVYDEIGRVPTLEDIYNYIKTEVGDERFNVIKESIDSDYNNFRTAVKKSRIHDLYGEQIEEKIEQEQLPPAVVVPTTWTERQQIAANAEVVDDNTELNKPTVDKTKPIVWLGNKIADVFKKLGFRNIAYVEQQTIGGDRKFKSIDINTLHAKDILNWNKFKSGSKLTLRLKPDSMVYEWDENIESAQDVANPSKTETHFSQYVIDNDLKEGDPKWIDKVPIEVIDEDGNVVDGVYIHSTDWYNPSNVAPVANQAQIISESKELVRALRIQAYQALQQGKDFQIEITDKTLGTKELIDHKGDPNSLPTLSANNPQSLIGFVAGDNSAVVNGKVIEPENILGIENFQAGKPIELRKVSETMYLAIHPVYNNHSNAPYVNQSMQAAFATYLLLNTQNRLTSVTVAGKVLTKTDAIALNDELRGKGIDLSQPLGVSTYLNSFIQMYSQMPDRDKLPENYIFAVMESGRLTVYNNVKVNNKWQDGIGLSGKTITDGNRSGVDIMNDFNEMFRLLQQAKMNVMEIKESLKSFGDKFPFILASNTEPFKIRTYSSPAGNSYYAFLKDHMRTNVKSWNIGEEGKPMYVTLVQPVIQIKAVGEVEKTDTEETSEEKVEEEIKEATAEGEVVAVSETETVIVPEEVVIEEVKEKEVEQTEQQKQQVVIKKLVHTSNKILNAFGLSLPEDSHESPLRFSEAQRIAVTASINTIEGLSEDDKHDIENYILATIFKNLNKKYGNKFTQQQFDKEVNLKFEDYFGKKLDLMKSHLQKMIDEQESLGTPNAELTSYISAFNKHIEDFEIIKTNWDNLVKDMRTLELDKYVSFKEVDFDQEEQANLADVGGEQEGNWDKDGFTENYKNSVSLFVKRFIFTIPQYRNNKPERGFMGVERYKRFEDNYNILMELIPGANKVLANKQVLMDYLNSPFIPDLHKPLARQVANMIKNNLQFSNGIQYAMTKSNLVMKMVMEEYDRKSKSYKMKLIDINANSAVETIRQQWASNFKISNILDISKEERTIKDDVREKMIKQLEEFQKAKEFTTGDLTKLENLLGQIGIKMHSQALKLLMEEGYDVRTKRGGKPKRVKGKLLFTDASGTFKILHDFLLESKVSEKANKNVDVNGALDFFETERDVVKKLAQIQNKFSGYVPTQSFRDGENNIYAYENMMLDKQTILGLKEETPEGAVKRQIKLQTLFDKHSYILQLMQDSDTIRKLTDIHTTAITSVRVRGKEVFNSAEVKDLSDVDYERLAVGMFTHKDKTLGETTKQGIALRMSNLLSLVSSDKKRRNILYAPVLALDSTYINTDNGTIAQNEQGDKVREFLFSQLVMPELERIIQHHQQAKAKGVHRNELHNQKDYNLGAQMFLMIPSLNEMTISDNGQPILDYLANTDNYDIDDIVSKFKEEAIRRIESFINEEVQNKVTKWTSPGYFTKNDVEEDTTTTIQNLSVGKPAIKTVRSMDTTYLTPWGNTHEKQLNGAAADFVINSIVSNANNYMLFSGDIANFAPDKTFDKGFQRELDENGNPTGKPMVHKPIRPSIYTDIVRSKIGVNLGKRLAMLIAPGAMLSDSFGDRYIQIFTQDAVRYADNYLSLIKLFYGDAAYEKEKQNGDKLKQADKTLSVSTDAVALEKAKEDKKEILSDLKNAYPKISAYFNIESTDAQEYTTWKEHLDILKRQGRIDEEQLNTISNKITNNIELDAKDKEIIFQPIKPVYTATIPESIGNDTYRNRTLYIKSSSFPLIPQLTKGLELDKLRLDMERLQNGNNGLNVRMSYGTANKVGATIAKTVDGKERGPIRLWNEDGTYNSKAFDNVNIDEIHAGTSFEALKLDRLNFRIQQDVPYKSAKNKEDKVSIGTQMMKLLFSNEAKKIVGEDSFNHYNDSFIKWLDNEKELLYRKLKFDYSTKEPTKESIEALQKLLLKEAKTRNYTKQDIDILTSLLNDNSFKVPLWLSPNSNRYEAFINAIIASKLVNLKLPGAAFILGSEEGFKQDFETARDNKSLVYTSAFNDELEADQIFVPSKFRTNNGKLIDLTTDAWSYTDEKTGRRMLDEKKIDKELLELMSFRIPTSSHVSGSKQRIAGFFPVTSGDLAIYNSALIKQKGFDYDVDKENTYWLHHYTDNDGMLKPLDRAGVEDTIEELKELIKEFTPVEEVETREQFRHNNIINFFRAKGLEDIIDDEETLIEAHKDLKALLELVGRKFESKLAQNEIIKMHVKVFSHPEMQNKIQQVLSTDFAEGQADIIEEIQNSGDLKTFSILSDEYQKYKMDLGSTGKTAIGVYSNYVTWHGLNQQSSKPIALVSTSKIEGQIIESPINIRIGNLVSDGEFGKVKILKPINISAEDWAEHERAVADSFAERQNTATDNEKLQILGRVGVNGDTINVDSLLAALGFDKDIVTDKNGNDLAISVPYFLLSQPIIRDYVKALNNAGSQIADFDLNKKATIKEKLTDKYGGTETRSTLNKIEDRKTLTGQVLYNNLQGIPDNKTQLAVLELFLELQAIAERVQVLQSHLNIQRQGLGKSFYEAQSKMDNIVSLLTGSSYVAMDTDEAIAVSNTDSYVGEYRVEDELTVPDEQKGKWTKLQTMKAIMWVKPTTFTGVIMTNAVTSYKDIFERYFPQQSKLLDETVNTILVNMGKDQTAVAQQLPLKYEILAELKRYLLSSATGLYPNAQEERKRLLFDDEKKGIKSLAKYLSDLKQNPDFEAVINTNPLLKTFDYDFDGAGKPSLIKYRNSRGEDLQEEHKYQALVRLLHDNKKLPPFNGDENYNTTTLVSDLISYAYAIGGTQSANEFVKYIPLKLIETLGITERLRVIHSGLAANDRDWYNTVFGDKGLRFQQQFFQHVPSRAMRLEPDDCTNFTVGGKTFKKFGELTDTLEIKADRMPPDSLPKFISLYNEKKPGKGIEKYQLYRLSKENGVQLYRRIPVLGVSGMAEYDSQVDNVIPLIDTVKVTAFPKQDSTPLPNAIEQPIESDPFGIRTGSVIDVLNQIENSNYKGLSSFVTLLKEFVDPATKIEITNINAEGKFLPSSNTIQISPSVLSDTELTAQIFVKEFVHSITVKDLYKYFERDGINTKLKDEYKFDKNVPRHIVRLNRVYNEIYTKLKDTKEFKDLEDKIQRIKAGKPEALTTTEFGMYGAVNIFEFTSEMFGNTTFQKFLASQDSSVEGKNLFERFWDAVMELFKHLGVKDDTKLAEGLLATFEFLKEEKIIKQKSPIPVVTDVVVQQQQIEKIVEPKPAPLTPTVTPTVVEGKTTVKDVHNAAIAADESIETDAFKAASKSITGKEHLDDMTPEELARMITYLDVIKKDKEEKKQKKELAAPKTEKKKEFSYRGKTIKTDFPLGEQQVKALESMIDYVEGRISAPFYTLEGYAGTGKTSIVGYLQKYFGSASKFAYGAPTHAASVQLAFSTVKTGNTNLPATIASAIRTTKNEKTGKFITVFTKKILERLEGFGVKVFVVDESSMLDNADLLKLQEAAANDGVKLVFMGDPKQIQKVIKDVPSKSISNIFNTPHKSQLTEIFRQSDNILIQLLDAVRNNIRPKYYKVNNTPSIIFTQNSIDFSNLLIQKFKEALDRTVYLTYTNDGVKMRNKQIRDALGFIGNVKEGELIIGYAGYNNKQIEKQHAANSVSYAIKTISKRGSYYKLTLTSSKLKQLIEAGMEGVKEYAFTDYYPLEPKENMEFGIGTQEEYAANNRMVADLMKKIHELNEAYRLKKITYKAYQDGLFIEAQPLTDVSLGDKYIYNPATDRMEKYNYNNHKHLKSEGQGSLVLDKGIDFGYAITIHKSQGLTMNNVFFDIKSVQDAPQDTPIMRDGKQFNTEKNSLLYVGMSRASELLVMNEANLSIPLINISEGIPSETVEVKGDVEVSMDNPEGFYNLNPDQYDEPDPEANYIHDPEASFGDKPPEFDPSPFRLTEDNIDDFLDQFAITKICD